jgi:hypothetical protein
MFRYVIPVDDQPHEVAINHSPVSVAVSRAGGPGDWAVEFWAENTEGAALDKRTFQVFGTGHVIPHGARWRGTCPRVSGLVFHLYELHP